MSDPVRVAVVIPAYDEVEGIRVTVESVRAVDYPQDLVEVVVAVDGGNEAVAAAAEAAGARAVLVRPNQGSYAARNAALAAIESDPAAVLFTDAGCVVVRDWIPAHLRALESHALSGGAVEFVFRGPVPTPAEWIDSLRHLTQQSYVERDGFAATCNLAVRRAVVDEMQFDPSLRTGGDADFCLRARAAGFDLVFSSEAAIRHDARPDRAALLAKVRRIASGAPRVRALQGSAVTPRARVTLGAFRRARSAALRVGPLWALRATLLDYEAQRVQRAVFRRQSER